jgi:DNA-directed RNA polymerase II subunit RPB1
VGNITKSVIGNSSGGMIHIIWKEKGPYPCRDFLSNTQLVINNWLYQFGFTVGVQDIIATKKTTNTIKEKMIFYKN